MPLERINQSFSSASQPSKSCFHKKTPNMLQLKIKSMIKVKESPAKATAAASCVRTATFMKQSTKNAPWLTGSHTLTWHGVSDRASSIAFIMLLLKTTDQNARRKRNSQKDFRFCSTLTVVCIAGMLHSY
mmetsp:Transcript_37654/g.76233  ORF Transcript_37654/g.76233 Transcript_37654/m.76233 type:complete len:130 (+) Transcript_37654:92-481(+)